MALIPPPYAATTSAVADSSVTVLTGDGIFFGGCFTSDGVKVIKIYDNTADSGTLIAQVTLAADESANLRYPGGIKVTNGIRVTLSGAGTHVGSVFYG